MMALWVVLWVGLCTLAVCMLFFYIVGHYWPSKPKFDPANIPVTKMNAANPILMLYDTNMILRRDVEIILGLLRRRGIEMIAAPVYGTNCIHITDLSKLPAADIDEVRKLIAEKVVV